MFKRLFLLTISLLVVSSSFAVKKEFRPYYNTAKSLNDELKNYLDVGDFHGGLAVVWSKGNKKVYPKRGFINRDGKLLIPCKYDFEGCACHPDNDFDDRGFCIFSEQVKTDGPMYTFVMGCLDSLGNVLIPFKYDYIRFDEAKNQFYADISLKDSSSNDRRFIYTRNGVLLPGSSIVPFSEGYLKKFYCDADSTTYGYKLSSNDSIICPCQFVDDSLKNAVFYPGPYCFTHHKGGYLMIDSMGHHLNETLFSYNAYDGGLWCDEEDAPIFEQIIVGVSAGEKKTLYGVVNSHGKMLIPCVYDYLSYLDGYFLAKSKEQNLILDSLGQTLCELPDSVVSVSIDHDGWQLALNAIPNRNAFLIVNAELSKVWLLDENRHITLLPNIQYVGAFSHGYAIVSKAEGCGYMDANLNIVVPCIFVSANVVASNGLAHVFTVMNKKGYFSDDFFIDIRKASQIKH